MGRTRDRRSPSTKDRSRRSRHTAGCGGDSNHPNTSPSSCDCCRTTGAHVSSARSTSCYSQSPSRNPSSNRPRSHRTRGQARCRLRRSPPERKAKDRCQQPAQSRNRPRHSPRRQWPERLPGSEPGFPAQTSARPPIRFSEAVSTSFPPSWRHPVRGDRLPAILQRACQTPGNCGNVFVTGLYPPRTRS